MARCVQGPGLCQACRTSEPGRNTFACCPCHDTHTPNPALHHTAYGAAHDPETIQALLPPHRSTRRITSGRHTPTGPGRHHLPYAT